MSLIRLSALSTLLLGLALGSTLASWDGARADTPSSASEVLTRLLNAPQVQEDWFAPSFLAEVPLDRIQGLVDRYHAQLGNLRSVTASGSAYQMRFEKGSVRATIVLGANGQITGLLFGVPVSNDPVQAKQQALASLKRLPGKVSYLITRNGTDMEASAPDERVPVGSAFKLAVLAALREQIAAGKHRWDEVVTLKERWKSLPSGILQEWPEGSPLTLQTLASLMISQSDNTAADALLDIVGREAAEKYAPGNAPFLSTKELFILKSPKLSSLLERYRVASTAQRRALLPEIDGQPFERGILDITPEALDIEWFFSPRELCGLLSKLGDDPVFVINPGVAERVQWRSVAFKGGSEPGVLNLSHQLVAQDGTTYCVVVNWTDPEADVDALTGIVAPLLGSLSGAQ
jgi:beta-lactamase class A